MPHAGSQKRWYDAFIPLADELVANPGCHYARRDVATIVQKNVWFADGNIVEWCLYPTRRLGEGGLYVWDAVSIVSDEA